MIKDVVLHGIVWLGKHLHWKFHMKPKILFTCFSTVTWESVHGNVVDTYYYIFYFLSDSFYLVWCSWNAFYLYKIEDWLNWCVLHEFHKISFPTAICLNLKITLQIKFLNVYCPKDFRHFDCNLTMSQIKVLCFQ